MSESAYENVVKGKLKLKGKALDVKGEGIFKKKKKHKITGGKRMVSSTDYIDSDVIETDNNSVDGKEQVVFWMTVSHHQRGVICNTGRKLRARGWLNWPRNRTVIGFKTSINISLI